MNTTTNEIVEELSIRDLVEDAYDDATDPVEVAPSAPTDAPAEAADDTPAAREDGRDDSGRFKPKAPTDAPAAPEVAPAPVAPEGIVPGPKSGQPPSATDRAPQAWKPEAREFWKDIPAGAKAEIVRHEQLVQQTLRETAEVRKFAGDVQRAVAPFEHFIKAEGSTAVAAIDNLMSTAAKLRTSTAPELAQMVTQIINQFGVGRFGNAFIGQLDNALSGAAPQAEHPEVVAMREAMNREMAPMRQMQAQMQQQQQWESEQGSQSAVNDIAVFEKTAEFLGDVRGEMADLLEFGAARGRNYTLQQAYDMACQNNPDISAVIAQRAQAKMGANLTSNARRARSAAVSVSGSTAFTSSGDGPGESMREQIQFAMNQNSR